jgi:hypothetical protein
MNETNTINTNYTQNLSFKKTKNISDNKKVCNICGADFVHKSRFDRFCDECREDELYHSVEWAQYS